MKLKRNLRLHNRQTLAEGSLIPTEQIGARADRQNAGEGESRKLTQRRNASKGYTAARPKQVHLSLSVGASIAQGANQEKEKELKAQARR
jgi:hypothetical protein